MAIHEAGVTHRDLKAENVILSDAGPKVVDFGIARHPDLSKVTASQVVLGTPGWLAPERLQGIEASPASDVFSWGLLVAYAASGVPAFGWGSMEALMYRVVHDSPDLPQLSTPVGPLGRLEPGAPADIVVWPAKDIEDMEDAVTGLVLGPERGVTHSLVAGEWVVRDGELLGCDIGSARRRVSNLAHELHLRNS